MACPLAPHALSKRSEVTVVYRAGVLNAGWALGYSSKTVVQAGWMLESDSPSSSSPFYPTAPAKAVVKCKYKP